MAHGTPDWGITSGAKTVYQLTDLAELAARLGSIMTYDRRGDAIWFEDFENGLDRWNIVLSGTGAAANHSTASSLRGDFSAELIAGSDASLSAELNRTLAFPVTSPLGLELAWSFDTNLDEAIALLDMETGALKLSWGIKYKQSLSQNYVLTGSGVWTAVGAAVAAYPDLKHFNTFKFVVDPSDLSYKRFLAGPLSLDVSGQSGFYAASVTQPRLALTGRIIGLAGTNTKAYADSMILTQNEPT